MSSKSKTYVMYGFKQSDIEMTAFLGQDFNLIEDMTAARRFKSSESKKSGSPQNWLDLVNDDLELNHGYKFHLVAVTN